MAELKHDCSTESSLNLMSSYHVIVDWTYFLPNVFVCFLNRASLTWIQFFVLGDNIFGSSTPDAAESLFKAFHPAMESGLPWAAVLGNHDQESTMSREELMSLISLMDYSISQVNPSADSGTDPAKGGVMTKIDGFGNYNLKVYGAPGSMLANSTVLNLFFLDSGDRAVYQGIRTYGWIKDSQLLWLLHVSQEFQVIMKF